ncbi:iron-containing redox enzyme family protein [Jannaschia rubra]|uniref:Heme oxygenase n=1 Tax=Jannaschia rubra TaxID=282197 RepID=A0A0M6XTV1_9RHOB|nr:iron-containing redox enzyme family protein [Jannaschia rubra]CTQ34599.1 hypothetical protein JAN5088_03395 [Jannaschia rubra]SFG72244.1 hypothetical protein SAMN04488517_11247 [Jannaschia rubra]
MTRRTPSERLIARLDLVHRAFSAQARKLWTGPEARLVYPVYLSMMHGVVRSAVPLMQAAQRAARALGPDDPLGVELDAYFAHHIPEETGHDVWLLEDLAATGHDPAAALAQVPPPAVAEMVGAQYYWIAHVHPVALLGHIAAIEAYHPPEGFARRLEELTGWPRSAFRAIARHEVLDVHHRRDLIDLIDRLPLRPEHEKVMALSGLHTVDAGMTILETIHARAVGPMAAE